MAGLLELGSGGNGGGMVNLPDLLDWDGRGDSVGRLCEVVAASHLFGTEDEVWKLFLQPFVEAGES
jgi:hypothetical protein